ncbi:MAG: hypothetical protein O2897_05980, partial [bacterium]|nr:hypothetical protein [bacterium]
MISFYTDILLLVLIALPAFTAAFIIIIPRFDMVAVRQISTVILILWLTLLLICGYFLQENLHKITYHLNTDLWLISNNALELSFGSIELILLLALWISLFSLFSLNKHLIEKNGLLFCALTMALLSLTTATILTTNVTISILVAHFNLIIFLFSLAHFGGTQKGRALFTSTIFFLCIDLSAIFILLLPINVWKNNEVILFAFLLIPALARLLIPFFSPFSRALFKNCPIENIILYISFIIPTGASLLFKFQIIAVKNQLLLELTPWISFLIYSSLFFSVFWTFLEKDPRQTGIDLLVFYNAIFIYSVFGLDSQNNLTLAASLIFSGILCAAFTILIGHLLHERQQNKPSSLLLNLFWQASLVLWMGFPGLGMGTSLWKALIHSFSSASSISIYTLSLWCTV